MLAYWADDDTFRASVEQRDAGEDGDNEFVFYDGPPFANGLPHYGHLLTGYVKDLVPRYQTMRGRRVERRFGWDTHGLPAELEAMRQLGMKTTEEILDLGIEKFNAECRKSVFEYTSEWRDYVTRQARWVDFDNDYKTLDLHYMESVMWAFKQLHDKGLAYEGFRVLPYCWNDETPLSNHELRMDEDVYQPRVDPAVTVGMRLTSGPARARWRSSGRRPRGRSRPTWRSWSAATSTTSSSSRTSPARRSGTCSPRPGWRRTRRSSGRTRTSSRAHRGADLLESSYTPPISYFLGHERAFRVVDADMVTTEDGTGLVHTAGAFGEEDKVVTDREGIEPVIPVAKDGKFTAPVDDYAGLHVFEANLAIIEHLRAMTRGSGGDGFHHAGHRDAAPRVLRALLPTLLALPRAADLHGGLVVVRVDDEDPRPDARPQPADPLGARARQGRPVRPVAREHPRLVDLPQPVLGLTRSRSGAATTRRTPGSTSTARSTSSSATSACAPTTCTGRSSTS